MITRRPLALLLALALAAGPAVAQPARPAPARPKVALAPLAALAGDPRAPGAGKIEAALVAELGKLGVQVAAPAEVATAIKAARQPGLRACDGDDGCLADLGALVGAGRVVAGEIGGLGDVQVVYLELVDVPTRKEVRRSQAPLGASRTELRAAVVQLLEPARYLGNLRVDAAIPGAAVFVDGRRVGVTPLAPVPLAVGPHALRVTHPDARDYVRFVDVSFEETAAITAELVPYASVDTAINATGSPIGPTVTGRGAARSPAWYRRWWAVAGFSAVVLGGAILAGTALADDVDADTGGTIGPP